MADGESRKHDESELDAAKANIKLQVSVEKSFLKKKKRIKKKNKSIIMLIIYH